MRRGFQENLAIALLLVGGFLYGVGWLVGVILLWLSGAWTAREKLIGTLVVPGGLALPLFLLVVAPGQSRGCISGAGVPTTCTNAGFDAWERMLMIAGIVLLGLAAVASAVFLARRARPQRPLAVSA